MSSLFDDLFIFEMANSHQGDVEHGKDIIHEMGKIARKYNIKAAVKLQYVILITLSIRIMWEERMLNIFRDF